MRLTKKKKEAHLKILSSLKKNTRYVTFIIFNTIQKFLFVKLLLLIHNTVSTGEKKIRKVNIEEQKPSSFTKSLLTKVTRE